MRHLLVPLDGSGFGETALTLAAAIAAGHGSRLELVTVCPSVAHPDIPATLIAEFEAKSRAQAKVYLEGAAEEVRRRFKVEVNTTALDGPITTAIAEHALADPPELIVMSTHGRTGPSRVFLGSVAERLVRELHSSFLLVRPGTLSQGDLPAAARVLVPLDGATLAESVLDEVARLFSPSLATLHLLRVVGPAGVIPIGAPMPLPAMEPDLTAARLASARRYLEETASRLRAAGWRVEHEVVTEWTPSAAILRYAEARHCDLIALATRGLGGIQRMFLGSVADKVIRGAATPVLVVNPAAGAFSGLLGDQPAAASQRVGRDVTVLQSPGNAILVY